MKTRKQNWFDVEECKELFGIQVYRDGKWMNASDSNGPLLFENEYDRDVKRKELSKQGEY